MYTAPVAGSRRVQQVAREPQARKRPRQEGFVLRKLVLLAVMLGMVMLAAAPALGQTEAPSQPIDPGSVPAGIQGPCPEGYVTQTGSDACVPEEDFLTCEEVYGPDYCVPPESRVTPPGPADGVCEGPGEADPDCAEALLESLGKDAPEAQYVQGETPAPTATPSTTLTVLPDTGGPSLLLPLAGLLVGSGLLGFAALRRRG